MAVKYLVQHRRGTAEQWAEQSTLIPREGEIVIEIDEVNSLHKLKIGDGVHTYAELAYLQAGDEIVTQVLNKAQPRVVTVELTLNWTPGENNTYSQVIALDNITKHSRLDLQPSAAMIAEFKELGLVFVTENNGGEITVYSIGNKPLKSYTMQATIVEVECTVDNVIGVPVVAPKDAITRADITDFAYTHSAVFDSKTGRTDEGWLKITIDADSASAVEGPDEILFDLYVKEYYNISHWTIHGAWGHEEGISSLHTVETHMAHASLYDKVTSDDEDSCSFYVQDLYGGYDVHVYVNDRGIGGQRVLGLSVEWVTELPDVDNEFFGSLNILAPVEVKEYEELKAKTEAVADMVGVVIRKTVFTDRPSLWTWLQENYRSVLKATIKTAEYHASNFGVAIAEVSDGTVHFEVSRQIVSTRGDETWSSVYTFEVHNDQVVQYSSLDTIHEDGSVIHVVWDNGIVIQDEYWTAMGVEFTVYYFDE